MNIKEVNLEYPVNSPGKLICEAINSNGPGSQSVFVNVTGMITICFGELHDKVMSLLAPLRVTRKLKMQNFSVILQ